MTIVLTLQQEIEESKKWLSRQNDDTTYKRDLEKKSRIDQLEENFKIFQNSIK
jgi:hypothetical protein